MAQRVDNLIEAQGAITFPAVPALVDTYVAKCGAVFAHLGREFSDPELSALKNALTAVLADAHRFSHRSTATVTYQSRPAGPLNYTVTMNPVTVEHAYEEWIDSREGPLFGALPDARVSDLAAAAGDPSGYRVLDIGAGTGRNALALARRGHPVDAAEPTEQFRDIIRAAAQRDSLDIRVIGDDVFAADVVSAADALRADYSMIVLSGVVTEFTAARQLREVFEFAAGHLAPQGCLVFNVFVAQDGYSPDEAARQFAQHSYSGFFTRAEIDEAAAGLALTLTSDDSVYDYERSHLPVGAWPPTEWYPNWVTGRDVFGPAVAESPIELRWLVYRWGR